MTERASAAEDAENRAERAETRAAELEERRREEAAAERSEAEAREAELRAMTRRSEEGLLETRRELAELTVRLEESKHRAMRQETPHCSRLSCSVTERQEERQKWEARVSRLCTMLEAVEEESRAAKTTSRAGSTDNSYQLLGQVRSDLHAAQSLVSSLTAENSQLV